MTARETMNILLATWEGGGSVAPILTVARKLSDRGHRVRVMSDRCNRPESEAAGAAFVAWTRAPSRPDRSRESDLFRDWEAASPPEQLERALDKVWAGPALAHAEDLIEELRREPADLVLSNELLFGVMVGCEAIGQRFALMTCNISLFPIEGVPPVGPGLAPARTSEEEAFHAQVAEGNRLLFDRGLPALNTARAAFGLPTLESLADQHLAAERIYLGTSRAFDFAPAELPPHMLYVGPQLGDPAWARPWHSPFEPGDQRPLVLAAFSTSFQDHVGILQSVIDAAADLPVRLLVTLGDTIAPDELVPAENCRLVHSAPHNAVMPEAILVVTHGGHGTVIRALAHRKPMLIIPHGRDQNDNAVRVTERGAGLALPTTASVAEIGEALRRLLDEPSFGLAASALGILVAGEAEMSPIVEELESLAGCRCGRTERAAA